MNKNLRTYAWKTAAALAASWLMMLGASYLLGLLGNHLTAVWGVTQENLHLAPDWVRLIIGQYGTWAGAAQNLALVPLGALLSRALLKKRLAWGRGAAWGLIGLAAGAALVALLRLTDAVRFGWSLARPRFGASMIAPLALYAASALGGEAVFRGVLLELGRGVPDWLAVGVSVLSFALMTAPLLPVALINALLVGLIMCLLYRRARGVLPGAMFRFALYALLYGVMGCAGGAAGAPYETYPCQLDLLSGGAAGPMNGLMATGVLAAVLALACRRGPRSDGARGRCPLDPRQGASCPLEPPLPASRGLGKE